MSATEPAVKKKTRKKKKATTRKVARKKKSTTRKSAPRKTKTRRTRTTTSKARAAKKKKKKTTRRVGAAKKTTRSTGQTTKTRRSARGRDESTSEWRIVKVGIDLGNYRTSIAASKNGEPIELERDTFPNVVGFLALDGDPLFAEEALRFRRKVTLKRPVKGGLVSDVKVCHVFAAHVCSTLNPRGCDDLWGVVSVPARATEEERRRVSRAMHGVLDRVRVVPEPYLAAEGMRRDESGHGSTPLTESALVVDIGATTTDLCVLRGRIPTADDQITLDKAGHWIDHRILSNSLVHCSGLSLTPSLAVEIKEEQAFVYGPRQQIATASLGSPELVTLKHLIQDTCVELLRAIVDASCQLLSRCSPERARQASENIILTGGGSRIRNLPERLEEMLQSRGYVRARTFVPADYKHLVARGALRLAEQLDEDEWENGPHERSREVALRTEHDRFPVEPTSFSRSVEAPAAPPPLAPPAPPEPEANPEELRFTPEDLEELELFKALG